ncbi:hypothetical protein V6N13_088736 [Hibiscus sabdariffa]
MVVEHRRRRTGTSGRDGHANVIATEHSKGSWLVELIETINKDEELGGLTKAPETQQQSQTTSGTVVNETTTVETQSFSWNEVYMASNPDKKIKAKNKNLSKITVIPLVEGHSARAISHSTSVKASSHSIVVIVEQWV